MIRTINIRSIVRQALMTDLPYAQIALSANCAPNTARRYHLHALDKNFDVALLDQMDDKQLDEFFNKSPRRLSGKRMLDFAKVQEAMKQKGMTLTYQWEQYCEIDPSTAYSFSQFTCHYRHWCKKNKVSMRLDHEAAEAFVDFMGKRLIWCTDKTTGERYLVDFFTACLGLSDLMFVYAVPSQSEPNWIKANIKMVEFFGGVPRRITCDNLKSAVIRAGRFPKLNRIYKDFEDHYKTCVTPARVRKPRDKAKVENTVLIALRWIMMRLRNRQFFSVDEINEAIAPLLEVANNKYFQKKQGTRRSKFEELDKPALLDLPETPYKFEEWIPAQKVPSDYRVRIKGHYYSVPYTLVGESVEARINQTEVEVLLHGRCVANHLRSYEIGGFTRDENHMPQAHRFYLNATPTNLLAWAKTVSPHISALCTAVYAHHRHPQPATNFCLALKRFVEESADVSALDGAAVYAMERQIFTMDRFRSIVSREVNGTLKRTVQTLAALPAHTNLRGQGYYR